VTASRDSPGAFFRALTCGSAALLLSVVVDGSASAHRALAAAVLPLLAGALIVAVVAHRRLIRPVCATVALFVLAAAVTARPWHEVLASLAFAGSCALAAASFRGSRVPRGRLADYVTLTKPRIMVLLLVTGACGMILGAHGWPGTWRFLAAIAGLALACGGASALNHVMDRDIDRLMGPRTAGRPVASGRLTAPRALEFGLALSACSFTLLAASVNLLTAVLALLGNVFYVVVYTGFLKRRGPQNIVLGGAAGAVPPLVGYAAATGNLALPALWLFLIVFLWTPPHFWALALLLRDHYEAADVPMLPVVRGERVTVRRIFAYTVVLVAFTVAPFAAGSFGWTYLVAALVLGGVFLALAVRLLRGVDRRSSALAFHYSLLYLALLFAAVALDAAL